MKKLSLIISTLFIVSCANNPFSSYKSTTDQRLTSINTSSDLTSIIPAQDTNDVLYNMEYGTLLRMQTNYESSNIYYSKAQTAIDTWLTIWANSTQGQLSNSMTAMLVNDNANDYDPRGYEKTMLPTMHALNQLDLNHFDAARIEVKKMYQSEQAIQNYNQAKYDYTRQEEDKLQKNKTDDYLSLEIKRNYNFSDIDSPEVLALTNSYQSAFSHYLAGFVFEALNEPSLSRPGYVNAGKLQPTNKLIQQSIDNLDKNQTKKAGYANLLIVQEVGHAPQIKSEETHIPIDLNLVNNQNSCTNMINVFYPKLIIDKLHQPVYSYNLDNTTMIPTTMTNIDLMAARSLKDEVPYIILRNVVAASRNIALSQASCSTGGIGSLISLGTSIGSMFVDKADERNWNLLPSKINVDRVQLPYGKHKISLTVNGVPHSYDFNLNSPYQVLVYRIIGNKVLFEPQKSMSN